MALMDALMDLQVQATTPLVTAVAVGGPAVVVGGLSWWLIKGYLNSNNHRRRSSNLPPLPEVPGLPLIGNLLQLGEKKPHLTFTKWAKIHGPIYSIRTGSNTLVVLNNTDVAKEAMVTRFSSISTRKLSKALKILTNDKCMVATSDYDEFHKTVKRHILTNVLGPNAQKQHLGHRDALIENTLRHFHAHLENHPHRSVTLRSIFEPELFGLGMKEALGNDLEHIYVEELGTTLSREDMLNVLVHDPMAGAIDVDWRDFFPYLKWVPNKTFEKKIKQMDFRREALMKSLIRREQSRRDMSGEALNCYLDYLLSEAKTLTEKQMTMLLWEVIIETADTTLVTVEWAMYQLAKNPECQDRLYQEIQCVCGSEKVTEEKLSQLPYLSAVFQETLRLHSPVPIIPLRYVHEDTQLGGYHIPAGSEIAVNIYGCNMDEKQWENPEEWKPERFLAGKDNLMDLHRTMAFGGGKRICAGSLQAMLISCRAIGRLVQELEWRLKDGEEADVNTLGLTARKLHPMQAIIKPRK